MVESLLEGPSDGDVMQLQERVQELPSELNDLCTKILKQVSKQYKQEASELFQFITAHEYAATLFSVHLSQQPVPIVLAQLSSSEDTLIEYRLGSMRRKIYSRCKCLLHVKNTCYRSDKVTYLHRTVRDYLLIPPCLGGNSVKQSNM